MPSASDDENASTSIIAGWWRSSPCLVASLHITPDDSTMHEAGDVPPAGVGVERAQHRLGEGVADDGDAVDALALDGVEQLVDVEATVGERDDRAAEAQDAERR